MSGISTFEVIITNPNGVCEPGQNLTGEVIIENHRHIKLKEIRLECSGIAHVHWVDTRNAEGSIQPESADEQYYNCYRVLYPNIEVSSSLERVGDTLCSLQPGSYSFPFEFPIPPKLPCSFEGPFGHVRYRLKAVIEKQWKLKVNVRPFTITPKLDLNNLPHCHEEIVKSKSMQLSSIFQARGSCFVSLHLSKQGYIRGEEIPVDIYVKNESKQTLISISISLIMVLHYETPTQCRHSKTTLAKLRIGKVNSGATINRSDDRLRIPTDLPPNLNGCGLINVRYVVILKIKPSYLSFSTLKIPIEIIIGTIPIHPFITTDNSSLRPPSYSDVMQDNDLPSYQDIVVP